jgi:hypothetical protein
MAILNKTNIIEIIFIILMLIFITSLISLVVLDELGYINTEARQCSDTCSINNKTGYFKLDSCKCCDKPITNHDYGTSIETNCYEVIPTNE